MPILSWDVNNWAYLEATTDWRPTWYKADHNDTIVRVPSNFFYTVASLSSIPPRFEKECKLAVESLLNQVDRVYVYIPNQYKRFGECTVPEWTRHPKITVVRGTDYGPASKYIGSIEEIPSDSWVFFCDDDQEYKPDLLQKMKSNIYTLAAYQNHYHSICSKTSGGIIHGYVGNLFHASLVKDARNVPLPECAYFVDDQWMSIYCHKQGIHVYPTNIERYNDIFHVLENNHEKLGTCSLSGLQNRDLKVKELETFFNVRFNSIQVHTISID
jgi:hypothetical protein